MKITIDVDMKFWDIRDSIAEQIQQAQYLTNIELVDYSIDKVQHAYRDIIPYSEIVSMGEKYYYCKNYNTVGIEWIREPLPSKVLIFIPNRNTTELALRAISSLKGFTYSVVIACSSNDDVHWPSSVSIAKVNPSISFTQLQNWFQKQAIYRELDYFYFMHSDAEATENSLIRLRSFYEKNPNWDIVQTNYDAFIGFKTASLKTVGVWDETFKWYVSDIDFYNRCKWRNLNLLTCPEAEILHNNPSSTLRSLSPDQVNAIQRDHSWAIAHYSHKWGYNFQDGGTPYLTPYGVDS